jgi:hypothetical protein
MIGFLVAGAAIFLLVPGAGRVLGPLLIAAACPLAMLGAMFAMNRKGASESASRPVGSEAATRDVEIADLRARLARFEEAGDAAQRR